MGCFLRQMGYDRVRHDDPKEKLRPTVQSGLIKRY